MDRLSLLVKAKETAEYFVDKNLNTLKAWRIAGRVQRRKGKQLRVVRVLLLTAVRNPQGRADVLLQQERNSCL